MSLISAIIPTRDRPELLRDCLATLSRQDAPGLLEVIVVDDGSTADLGAVVDEFRDGPVPMQHVRQEPSGLNPGRNRGASVARGDVLAYLDDDTLVDGGWASAMRAAFDSEPCDGVAGRIILQLEGEEPTWLTPGLRRYLSELDFGREPRWLDDRYPVGANCAVRREAFDRVGGFRTGLDRVGTSLVSNGDNEFFDRVRRSGGRLLYWPRARVLHRVPPDRLTADFFRRRAYAQGVSDGLLHPATGVVSRAGQLAREALRAGRAAPILAKALARRQGSTNASVWLQYCRGRAAVARGRQP